MGEAKLRSRAKSAILANEPRCIYCEALAETVEHMPPLVMFKKRSRPSGMEFASCKACNNGTSGSDLVASFLSRLGPFDEPDDWRIREAKGLTNRLKQHAPGVLDELIREDKREGNWIRGPGGILVPSVVIQADGPLLKSYLKIFAAKMGMALYREYVGVALPMTGGVLTTSYLNLGLAQKTADVILKLTPQFGTLKQGTFQVQDQFAYRYNTDEKSVLLALIGFHARLHIVVFATSMPGFYNFPANPLFSEPYVNPGTFAL